MRNKIITLTHLEFQWLRAKGIIEPLDGYPPIETAHGLEFKLPMRDYLTIQMHRKAGESIGQCMIRLTREHAA